MTQPILTVNHLTKTYKHQKALNDFSLTVQKGEIVGIIGPNGAGKTTLLRSIVGLTPTPKGAITLFGSVDQEGLETNRHFVGTLIESPAFIPQLSAEENLKYYSIQRNVKDKTRVAEVLALVGLEETGKKKVKNFSLGMKQRLAIALALLHNPEILILDEPINGLDPTGIIHIRELLRRLSQESQLTVLISSHILSELEQLATHFVIVDKGRNVAQFSHDEINQMTQQYYVIGVNRPEEAVTLLNNTFQTDQFSLGSERHVHCYQLDIPLHEIAATLVQHQFELSHLASQSNQLESVFMSLTESQEAK